METATQEAWELLNSNREVLDELAARLLEKETILEAELKEIFQKIRKAPPREQWLSAPSRPVSDLPPVPLPPEPTPAEPSAAELTGAESAASEPAPPAATSDDQEPPTYPTGRHAAEKSPESGAE